MSIRRHKEKWKKFRHGYYQVSNLGRVRRYIGVAGCRKGRIIKQFRFGKYLKVTTSVCGKLKDYMIHQLVARKFIGSCPRGKFPNHKDLNKFNNRRDNLEYLTPGENIQHAYDNGVEFGFGKGEKHWNVKLTQHDVHKIRYLRKHKKYTLWKLANRFKVSVPHVSRICSYKERI
jgi:hypothetical protein